MYHYCSLPAFQGIVESKKLWASNSHFLNDHAEVKTALGKLQRSMELVLAEIGEAPFRKILATSLERVANEEFHVFVSSFSKQPDKLSQWRGYAHNGHGVALGFSQSALERLGFLVSEVLYEEKFLSELAQKLKSLVGARSEPDDDKFRKIVARTIMEAVSTLKPKGFVEEEEVRLTIFTHQPHAQDVKYRVSGNLIVPYVEIDLSSAWPDVIEEVWMGPMLLDESCRASVRHFLDGHGLHHVRLNASRTTYRS